MARGANRHAYDVLRVFLTSKSKTPFLKMVTSILIVLLEDCLLGYTIFKNILIIGLGKFGSNKIKLNFQMVKMMGNP